MRVCREVLSTMDVKDMTEAITDAGTRGVIPTKLNIELLRDSIHRGIRS